MEQLFVVDKIINIGKKLWELTKVVSEHMNNTYNVIIELIQKETSNIKSSKPKQQITHIKSSSRK